MAIISHHEIVAYKHSVTGWTLSIVSGPVASTDLGQVGLTGPAEALAYNSSSIARWLLLLLAAARHLVDASASV